MSNVPAKTNLIECYNKYNTMSSNPIDKQLYFKIVKDFNERIINKIVEGGYEFIMPYNLGSIFIKKRKIEFKFDENGNFLSKFTKAGVNWKATKDLWILDNNAKENKTLVWNDNSHTDGFKYRFFWDRGKTGNGIKNILSYKFMANRVHGKRNLAKVLKQGTNISYYL